MEIRFLSTGDDLSEISGIYEKSWKYAYRGIISQEYLDSIPQGHWANSVTQEGIYTLVMAERGDIIGTASFCKSRWEKYSDYGEIVSIYFLPEYMGMGYGKQLFKRCIEELQKLGFCKMLLWVLEENHRARAFYEKNGFSCAGEYLNDSIGGKALREVMYTMKETPAQIGLKRGTVRLEAYQPAWEQSAVEVISELRAALEGLDVDIQHIGSTSIKAIKAKPIIDIAVAVESPDVALARNEILAGYGIIFCYEERPAHLLYTKGDFAADTRTHHIHVMPKSSAEWQNYLNFRDYLNANARAAAEYEAAKIRLAAQYPNDRNAYTDGKAEIISRLLAEAAKWRKQNP